MTDSARGLDVTAREAVGGLWEVIGPLQFRFLLDEGLQPHHTLLDIGCGCLRGGVHYVGYLADGHYYGIEAACWLLEAGRDELARAGLGDRRVHLLCRDDFDCSSFGTTFDFAIAQSLFTHLPWNSIQRCLAEAQKVLAPGGRLYATFFEGLSIVARGSPSAGRRGDQVRQRPVPLSVRRSGRPCPPDRPQRYLPRRLGSSARAADGPVHEILIVDALSR